MNKVDTWSHVLAQRNEANSGVCWVRAQLPKPRPPPHSRLIPRNRTPWIVLTCPQDGDRSGTSVPSLCQIVATWGAREGKASTLEIIQEAKLEGCQARERPRQHPQEQTAEGGGRSHGQVDGWDSRLPSRMHKAAKSIITTLITIFKNC